MEEMILAEPALAGSLVAADGLDAAAALLRESGGPLLLVGCGTSEHAALAGAALLGGTGRDAFEAALEPPRAGALIAISHEAGTAATLAALAAAPVPSLLITARPDRVVAGAATRVLATPLVDRSWCHTVGYLSPLVTLAALAGERDGAAIAALLAAVLAERARFAAAAAALAGCERLLVVGSGVDAISARELALKIEEGVHVPCRPLALETLLHGHLPAADARTGLVLLRLDARAGERRDARADDALAACAALSMPTVVIGGDATATGDAAVAGGAAAAAPGEAAARVDAAGAPLRVPLAPLLRASSLAPVPAALLAGALALQLLTLELVHAAGTNPDLIRREQPAYAAAAAASNT